MNTAERTPEEQNQQEQQADWFDEKNTRAEYDPYARNTHSESEIQQQERADVENNPGTEPAIPGNLPPERVVPDAPEYPVRHEEEISPRSVPEIQVNPNEESQQPELPEIPDKRNRDNMSPVNKENPEVISRVFPSIENHDNLEGTINDKDENWEREDKDLDIDNDSNRQE